MTSNQVRNYLTAAEENLLNSGFTASSITKSVQDNSTNIISTEDHDYKKSVFIQLLQGTDRDGIDQVLTVLQNSDFYTAPASTVNHENYDGGLLDHSLMVCKLAVKLRNVLIEEKPSLADRIPVDSLIICSLLHDVCKMGYYQKVEKWKKDKFNNWQSYQGYEIQDSFPIGHGEKSVIMLQKFGLDMNAEEMIAIRFHMGSYSGAHYVWEERSAYDKAINDCPLLCILQSADYLASMMLGIMVKPDF